MSPTYLRRRAFRHAKKRVGVAEVGGNNRGYWVERIIRYARGVVPEPWCVDFVIWCYGHAGSEVVKPGYTRAVRFMYYGPGQVRKLYTRPWQGHIVRFAFDHTGLFWYPCNALGQRRPWATASHIKTIEGNTGSSGATSDGTLGDGVHVRIRSKAIVRDYLEAVR